MKQIIKTGKGLLYKIEHPVEIPYSEITLDSIIKLVKKYEIGSKLWEINIL